jgi:hypothetical protein
MRKVVGYINKLENYDTGDIAKIAIDNGLYEEALTIYKKYYHHAMAIRVPGEHIVSIDHGPTKSKGLKFGVDWLRHNWMACRLRTLLIRSLSLY